MPVKGSNPEESAVSELAYMLPVGPYESDGVCKVEPDKKLSTEALETSEGLLTDFTLGVWEAPEDRLNGRLRSGDELILELLDEESPGAREPLSVD